MKTIFEAVKEYDVRKAQELEELERAKQKAAEQEAQRKRRATELIQEWIAGTHELHIPLEMIVVTESGDPDPMYLPCFLVDGRRAVRLDNWFAIRDRDGRAVPTYGVARWQVIPRNSGDPIDYPGPVEAFYAVGLSVPSEES